MSGNYGFTETEKNSKPLLPQIGDPNLPASSLYIPSPIYKPFTIGNGEIIGNNGQPLLDPNDTYHNQIDLGNIIGSGTDFISSIIGHATGSTAQQLENQRLAAQAQIAQAEALKAQAQRKSQAVTVAIILVIGAVVITGGVIAYKKFSKK